MKKKQIMVISMLLLLSMVCNSQEETVKRDKLYQRYNTEFDKLKEDEVFTYKYHHEGQMKDYYLEISRENIVTKEKGSVININTWHGGGGGEMAVF